MIGIAILKSCLLDGIEIIEPSKLGKHYIVDLRKIKVEWFNNEFQHGREVEAVMDIETGGFLPIELLELKECIMGDSMRN